MEIGIIGGGLSGLVCAYRLQEAGFSPILFEKEATLGGRVKTEIINDVPINVGAQIFNRVYKNLMSLILELELKNAVKKLPTDQIVIYTQGEVYHPNAKSLFSTSLFSKSDVLRVPTLFFDVDSFKLTVPPEEEFFNKLHHISWRDYLLEKGCPTNIIENLIDPLAKYIASSNSSQISASYGKFLGLEFIKPVNVLEGGLSKLTEALKSRIEQNVEILVCAEVEKIELIDGKFSLTYKQDGTGKDMNLDILIASIPLPELNDLFPDLSDIDLEYASLIQLVVEGKKHASFQEAYIIVPNITNNSIVCCIGNARVSSVFVDDEEYSLAPIFQEYNIIKKVYHKYAHPMIRPNIQIPSIFPPIRNFYLCGDFYYYPSLETAVVTGQLVAEKIISLRG